MKIKTLKKKAKIIAEIWNLSSEFEGQIVSVEKITRTDVILRVESFSSSFSAFHYLPKEEITNLQTYHDCFYAAIGYLNLMELRKKQLQDTARAALERIYNGSIS